MAEEPQALLLLDLPTEILTHIFLFLPPTSILTCQRVNHYLQNLISNSVELQYRIHAGLTAQLDNPCCTLPASERLAQLHLKNNRWEELSLNFSRRVQVPFQTSGIYDLTAGVYLLGDSSRKALYYTYLPTHPDDEIVWKELHTAHQILDMGLCVYEHDLLAVLTTQFHKADYELIAPPRSHEIHLFLYEVSTGKPHPEAQQPEILVTTTRWEKPAIGVEIVGDNLVLILAYYQNPFKPDDQVFIFEWRTGRLKSRFSAPCNSYSDILFLTTNIFVLPNANTGALEFWRIPRDVVEPTSPQHFFALSLPTLNKGRKYRHISCRAEPNPTATFRHSSKPFHADPHYAIAIFNVNVLRTDMQGGPADPLTKFEFFVHRSSLLQCLQKFSTQPPPGRATPHLISYSQWGPPVCRWFTAEAFPRRWITTTAGQKCVIVQEIGWEVDSTPLILLNFNQKDVAKVLDEEERERRAWALAHLAKARISGKRHRQSSLHPTMPLAIEELEEAALLRDLSTHEYHQILTILGGEISDSEAGTDDDLGDGLGEVNSSSPRPKKRVKAMARLNDALEDPHGCFQEITYSSLPYTVCSSNERYDFSGALLDEERIIGLGTNIIHRITTVDILHFG